MQPKERPAHTLSSLLFFFPRHQRRSLPLAKSMDEQTTRKVQSKLQEPSFHFRKSGNCFLFLFVMACSLAVSSVNSQNVNHLVISQVYGGGGNSTATYVNDFIEIFNPTGSAVNVNGWSVQYASSTGSSWTVTTLNGSIAAGKYYLIAQASGGAVGSFLPQPDQTGTTNIAAGTGKLPWSVQQYL